MADNKKVWIASLKIIIPLYATYALFVFSIFTIFIPQLRNALIEQKKEMIRGLTETTISLISKYDDRVQQGELSLDEAQKSAKNQIRTMRYGPEGKDYFWISDMHPFMVMHPYRQDLEGRDLTLFRDTHGNYPFMAMVERVMQQKGGYVNYYWQWKDSSEKIVPKTSYVKGFVPWGWIVGTGLYTEDLEHEIQLILTKLSTLSLTILLIILGASFYLTFQTIRSEKARIRSIDALRRSEAMHRKFIDHAPMGMYTLNLKGKLTYINHTLEKMTGYQKETWLHQSFTPIVHPEDLPIAHEKFRERIQQKGRRTPYEIRILNHVGETRWLKIISESIYDDPNSEDRIMVGIQSFVEDITEMKTLEARYIQAQKMEAIGTLAGGIAHDFNNILSIVMGFAQLAQLNQDQPEKLSMNIEQILKGTEKATQLVQQILTFGRQSPQQMVPISLAVVIKESMKLLRATIPSTIEMKVEITANATVMADATKIHQVIMNLCTNAYHAMFQTGGILAVGLHEITFEAGDSIPSLDLKPGRYLKLEVSDSGHGMDPVTIQKIFDPYFTTKPLDKGTGLGLAVVFGIIQEHQGVINVYSEPGEGTTFHIYLPVVQNKVALEATKEASPLNSSGTEHILLVDDEEALLNANQDLLNRLGYGVTAFNNASEACTVFQDNPEAFDVVITDMTMPGMTGMALSQQILEQNPSFPIILCTGHSELINREKAMAMGIAAYLEKPVTIDRLAKTVREVLDHS